MGKIGNQINDKIREENVKIFEIFALATSHPQPKPLLD
jgi:hypothetical protein